MFRKLLPLLLLSLAGAAMAQPKLIAIANFGEHPALRAGIDRFKSDLTDGRCFDWRFVVPLNGPRDRGKCNGWHYETNHVAVLEGDCYLAVVPTPCRRAPLAESRRRSHDSGVDGAESRRRRSQRSRH